MSHLITKPTHVTQELLHATRDKYLNQCFINQTRPAGRNGSNWNRLVWVNRKTMKNRLNRPFQLEIGWRIGSTKPNWTSVHRNE